LGDIFNEVDEDVRRDQIIRLWRRYGKYFVALLALVIVGTGTNVAWNHFKTQRMMADGSRFAAAMGLAQIGQYEQAVRSFSDLAAESGVGYSQLAQLQKAAALIALDNYAEAISIYDDLAALSSTDIIVADLATILAGLHRIDNGREDEAAITLLKISESNGPWRHVAREMRAMAVLKSGDKKSSHEILTSLVEDPTSPSGVRSRAIEVLGTLNSSAN